MQPPACHAISNVWFAILGSDSRNSHVLRLQSQQKAVWWIAPSLITRPSQNIGRGPGDTSHIGIRPGTLVTLCRGRSCEARAAYAAAVIFMFDCLGTRLDGTNTTSNVAADDIHCYDSGSTPHEFPLFTAIYSAGHLVSLLVQ